MSVLQNLFAPHEYEKNEISVLLINLVNFILSANMQIKNGLVDYLKDWEKLQVKLKCVTMMAATFHCMVTYYYFPFCC